MDDPFPPDLMPAWEILVIPGCATQDYLEAFRPGRDLYPDIFHGSMFPLQRKRELFKMMQIARRINPRVVAEIGADKGGGLFHWCACLPTVHRVMACEIRGTPYQDLFRRAFPDLDFLFLEASSYAEETVAQAKQWLTGKVWQIHESCNKIDCLFIDGDKSAFLLDFDAYLPMMNPRGIVFMHDVRDDGPRQAFENIKVRGYRTEHIIDTSESETALERERRGEPVTTAYEGWLRHWRGESATVGVIYLGA